MSFIMPSFIKVDNSRENPAYDRHKHFKSDTNPKAPAPQGLRQRGLDGFRTKAQAVHHGIHYLATGASHSIHSAYGRCWLSGRKTAMSGFAFVCALWYDVTDMKKILFIFAVALFVSGCVACRNNQLSTTALGTIDQNPGGNFVLYVSNQSFAIPRVDILILIDGRIAVKDTFDVGTQHNWIKHTFSLNPGKHTIRAVSIKGSAEMEREFEVKKKHWAVVNYWYYPPDHYDPTPKCFSFHIDDKPMRFASNEIPSPRVRAFRSFLASRVPPGVTR